MIMVMATVLLLLVLFLRESAALVCLDCQMQVANCTVTASTGELVCRAPECIPTTNVPQTCRQTGGLCMVTLSNFKISNSSVQVSYRPFLFCRSSDQVNVSINPLCVQAFDSSQTLPRCGCTTDNCNNQIVLTGYATPVPSPTAGPSGNPTASPTASIMPEWWLYVIIFLAVFVLLLLFLVVSLVVYFCIKKRSVPWKQQHTHHRHKMNLDPQDDEEYLPLQLIQTIGRGKFGSVWKAAYQGGYVAVKIFTPNYQQFWIKEKEIYSRESTGHENVLKYFCSEMRGSGYNSQLLMITEYCPLGSLLQFLQQNELEWNEALTIMLNVASGLTHLHSNYYTSSNGVDIEKYAVAHRDIKPANVLVKDRYGHCVVGDLGLALTLDPSSDQKSLASSGQVGTFRYMAPEALDARVNLRDIESFKQIDIYALALVMWEVTRRCNMSNIKAMEYSPPYSNQVGERPTLEKMKSIVVVGKHRPPIPENWKQYESLKIISELLLESWDEDPEARLTAANISNRLDDLRDTKPLLSNETTPSSPLTNNDHTLPSPSDSGSQLGSCYHSKLHTSLSYSGRDYTPRPRLAARYSVGSTQAPQIVNLDCVTLWQQQQRAGQVDAATGQPERHSTNSSQQDHQVVESSSEDSITTDNNNQDQ